MYMRLIRGQVNPGKMDEFAQRWQQWIGTAASPDEGGRHAYLGADRATNTIVVVSLWDSRPDEAVRNQRNQAFMAQVANLVSGQPNIETYEILAEG